LSLHPPTALASLIYLIWACVARWVVGGGGMLKPATVFSTRSATVLPVAGLRLVCTGHPKKERGSQRERVWPCCPDGLKSGYAGWLQLQRAVLQCSRRCIHWFEL